jgi:hypothetical protein
LPRQVQFQGLFEPTRQLRSSSGLTDGGLFQTRIRQLRGGTLTAACRVDAVRHVEL